MNVNEFLQLPPGVVLGVVVMMWPAIWAAALVTVALAGDLMRQTRKAAVAAVAQDRLIRR